MSENTPLTKALVLRLIRKKLIQLEKRVTKRHDEDMTTIQQTFLQLQTHMDERFVSFQKQMDDRFAAMQKQMDDRFAAMQTQIDERFAAVDERFDRLEAKIDKMQNQIDRFLDLHLASKQEFDIHADGASAHENVKERMAELEKLHGITPKQT